jgi:hypothetical protein
MDYDALKYVRGWGWGSEGVVEVGGGGGQGMVGVVQAGCIRAAALQYIWAAALQYIWAAALQYIGGRWGLLKRGDGGVHMGCSTQVRGGTLGSGGHGVCLLGVGYTCAAAEGFGCEVGNWEMA